MTVWPLQSDDKLAVLIVAFAIVVCIATAIQSPKPAEFQDVQVPEIIVPAAAARSFQEMLSLSTSNIDSGNGVHGYYEDPNANPWFFVTLPRS